MLDFEDVMDALQDNLGWCTECQDFTTEQVEPDAARYRCSACRKMTVYGAEQALLLGLLEGMFT